MKTITKIIIAIALIFNVSTIFSQVTTTISNMATVPYNTQIADCGTIDLESYNELRLQFTVNLSKQQNMVVGTGTIRTYYKKSSTDSKIEVGAPYSVPANFGTSFSASLDKTIQASNFNLTGGIFFVEYTSTISTVIYTSTCSYSVIKTQTPTFNISPSSVNITCGNTSSRTFSVINVYNTAGTKSYKWQVGNSQLYNGSPAPNEFTTTSSTITLVPNTFPLNNIKVATILNGTQLPFSTSNVSLTSIENRTISGDLTVCSSETLSINNLGISEIVTWSSSNTSVASISTSNNQATVYANGSGIVTISATISNSCGQQLVLNKTVTLGVPTDYYDANIDVHPYPGNYGGIYLNNWTRMWMTNYPGGLSWNWTANYSMIQNPDSSQPLIKPLSNGYMTIKVRKSNKCGYGSWVSKNFNVTPLPDGGHKIERY